MNTVLAIAGGDSRIEISTLTDDQKALHTAKVNELLNMNKFGVVEVVDRPQSKQVLSNSLGIKTETGWILQGETCCTRIRTNGQFRYRLLRWNAKALDFACTSLTIAALHGNPVAFGDCRSAFHQSPLPSDSEPVNVEPAPEAQLDSSKVWLCKKAFRGLKVSPQAWRIHGTQKINDKSYNQLISDLSTVVKKCAQRSGASILLRHMDDVVGTGLEEHLMSDFEHMKSSLYVTDVVVLRHEGDTVNFLGLEITKTSEGFEVKNSTDLVNLF